MRVFVDGVADPFDIFLCQFDRLEELENAVEAMTVSKASTMTRGGWYILCQRFYAQYREFLRCYRSMRECGRVRIEMNIRY